jgi:hypothetical protein
VVRVVAGGATCAGRTVAGGAVAGGTVRGTVVRATVVGGVVGFGLGFAVEVDLGSAVVLVGVLGADLTADLADEPQPARARSATTDTAARERQPMLLCTLPPPALAMSCPTA